MKGGEDMDIHDIPEEKHCMVALMDFKGYEIDAICVQTGYDELTVKAVMEGSVFKRLRNVMCRSVQAFISGQQRRKKALTRANK